MIVRGCSVAALVVLLIATAAQAQMERGNWELTLAAVGSNDKDFNDFAVGVNAGVGYFLTDWLELGGRQTLSYSKLEGSSATDASSAFAVDLHLPLLDGRLMPFIGGNFGFFYGDTIHDSIEYGPEAGVKYFVNSTTFIYGRVEYEIFSNDILGSSSTGSSQDRQFVYLIGIGLRF